VVREPAGTYQMFQPRVHARPASDPIVETTGKASTIRGRRSGASPAQDDLTVS
jgi:hypothetical protein